MTLSWDSILQAVLGFFTWLWGFWQVKFILGHIGLNLAASVAASIYLNEFLLGKLGQFLYRKTLPFVLLYAAFAAFGQATNMEAMSTVAFAGIEAMLAADLFDNLKKVGLKKPEGNHAARDNGGGFTVPDWLTK